MMENVPGVRRTSVKSIQTCYIEVEGQEAIWVRKPSREMSAKSGNSRAMETISIQVGQGNGMDSATSGAQHKLKPLGLQPLLAEE